MRVMLGQINTTPGAFAQNCAKISTVISAARHMSPRERPNVIVFPELSIPGYLSQDLMYHKGFIQKNLEYLEKVKRDTIECSNTYVIVGYIDRNRSGSGKPFRNAAAVIKDGLLIATYYKQLLPFYDVFDEGRYFEPGLDPCVVEMFGHKVGLAICEDVWNDKGSDDYNYTANPLQIYRSLGVDTIISLNSSPYTAGKAWKRARMVANSVDGNPIKNFVYVNQVGGQDELVFDGNSFVLRKNRMNETVLGGISTELYQDSHNTFRLDDPEAGVMSFGSLNSEEQFRPYEPKLRDLLVLGLRDYVKKTGFHQVVFGSSGGVDSAVVASLAVDALGADKVHAIMMPSQFSSDSSITDAEELHDRLGINQYCAPIGDTHNLLLGQLNQGAFRQQLNKTGYNEVASENIQARIRDVMIMHFSNASNVLPLGTGNKTESACGYYTHFDMSFGFAPLKDVYKQQIFEMAKADKRIPENIWKKPPSAELADGQTDEASLLPYAQLDLIVRANIEDYVSTFAEFEEWLRKKQLWYRSDCRSIPQPQPTDVALWMQGDNAEISFDHIINLIARNEYKRRQTCPGVKITPVAFGIGRRYPIVQGFIK